MNPVPTPHPDDTVVQERPAAATAAAPPSGAMLPAALRPLLISSSGGDSFQVPTGGRIRSGGMVLHRDLRRDDVLRGIYADGIADGSSFQQIGARIAAVMKERGQTKPAKPLYPVNRPYFVVRASDFANPQHAADMMRLYGTPDAAGVVRLHKFPIVFPFDAIAQAVPHELAVYTPRGRQFWSTLDDDGTRRCNTWAPVAMSSGNRPLRQFGGRRSVPRPDNGGMCDPEACPQYQLRQCNLKGRLIFYVPGIDSVAPFDLPTSSIYAIKNVVNTLRVITAMGGHISGYLNAARQLTFMLSKQLVQVVRIDDNGEPATAMHWIVTLSANADPTELLRRRASTSPAREPAEDGSGQKPLMIEAGTATDDPAGAAGDPGDGLGAETPTSPTMPSTPPAAAAAEAASTGAVATRDDAQAQQSPSVGIVAASAAQEALPAAHARPQATAADDPGSQDPQAPRAPANAMVAWITECAASLGVDPDDFDAFSDHVYGRNWRTLPNVVAQVTQMVAAYSDEDSMKFMAHVRKNMPAQ